MKLQTQDRKEWHRWFAWHPVWVNNNFVWFETVQRRWIYNASSAGDSSGHSFDVPGWEYKE